MGTEAQPRTLRGGPRPGPLVAALLLALACGAAAPADPEVVVFREARFRLEGEAAPAADAAAGEVVSLPDPWRSRRPDAGGFAVYEIRFPGLVPEGRAWSVLLPSVNMNAEVFVNGTRIGSGGSLQDPVAQNFNRPLFFWFPASLAQRGENLLGVRLWAYPHAQGGLGPVWLGPERVLRPVFERRLALQRGLAQLATAIAWLTALFVAALWVGTRFDGVYGWFALAIALWSVTSLNYWVRDLPVSHWSWERLVHPALEGFAVSLAIWAHRFVGLRRPRIEAALASFAVLGLAVSALAPRASFYSVANVLHAGSLAIGAYATLVVLKRFRRYSAWERSLYLAGGALGLGFAAHDLGVQLGWIRAGGFHLFPYLVPVILFGFGASLVARFVSSLETAESLNRELEQRVREKSREIERNHERLLALEHDRTIAAERERIMREMHDGLGGQLVSALALVESGGGSPAATADALRAALADMRLVIDSLDPALGDLAALLGALRARLSPLLEQAGLRLEWRVASLPATTRLGPERSLHVLRVLQEAITNSVRHAQASSLTVECRRDARALHLEVRDDGCSFDPGSARSGWGLRNMQRRAEALEASLAIASGKGGTRVTLSLPWVEPAPVSPPG